MKNTKSIALPDFIKLFSEGFPLLGARKRAAHHGHGRFAMSSALIQISREYEHRAMHNSQEARAIGSSSMAHNLIHSPPAAYCSAAQRPPPPFDSRKLGTSNALPASPVGSSALLSPPVSQGPAACGRRTGAWRASPGDSRWRSAYGPSTQGSAQRLASRLPREQKWNIGWDTSSLGSPSKPTNRGNKGPTSFENKSPLYIINRSVDHLTSCLDISDILSRINILLLFRALYSQ
jgi:hypothetical protein